MIRLSLIYVFLFNILLIYPSYAASLKAGYGACISLSSFNEYITALSKKDQLALQYLEKKSYIKIIDNKYPISIMDYPSLGIVKVRVYVAEESAILWTFVEAIKE